MQSLVCPDIILVCIQFYNTFVGSVFPSLINSFYNLPVRIGYYHFIVVVLNEYFKQESMTNFAYSH